MFIQNVSLADIKAGYHMDPSNAVLIQIVDPAMKFPKPNYDFVEVHQFEFLDLEKTDDDSFDEFKITEEQARQLVDILSTALDDNMDVIVHCVAGICRSGAVAEVGTMMGFTEGGTGRQPNLLVKHKMMKVLDWLYDEDEESVLTYDADNEALF